MSKLKTIGRDVAGRYGRGGGVAASFIEMPNGARVAEELPSRLAADRDGGMQPGQEA